ncbi:MAG: hypothetical protein KH275_04795 [Clostridiales bacterium]|nr:hypothetical protein [Clostridiales bacterium]
MMDIKIFQEKLEQILAQAREQDKTLSGQDIREVFGEELSASQMQSLLEYLRLQGIRLDVTRSLAGDGRMFEAAAEKTAGGQGQGAAGQQESCGEKADAPATDPLSSEEEEYLRDYEASLAGIPAETERERESLWVRYDSGDGTASARLTELYLPETVKIARELHREEYFIGDLIQEGNMCLIAALEQGRPENMPGHQWLTDVIRQGIGRWIEEQREQKYQDESLVEQVRKLEAAIRELSDDEQRDYSVAELSAFLDMDEEEIRSVLSLTGDNGASDGSGKG